ncbi:MAG TPA: GNAT family N-acetyltransferase [Terracidiphilus sp.]|nr:GNAT family N-acetyltransferase [Terracidiphilus sp.]
MSPIQSEYLAVPCGGSEVSVEIVSSQTALEKLAPEWDRLCKEVNEPNAFMTYGWYRAWTKRHMREQRSRYTPYVVVLRQGDAVSGIAPLIMRTASRWLRVRKLEFATIHSDYNDFLVAQNQATCIESFVQYLSQTANEWDLIDLRDLRNPEESLAQIERALTSAGLSFHRTQEKEGCPFLPIDGGADHAMKKLSGHVRRVLRKRLERAAAEGLTTRILERPDEDPGLIEKLVALDLHKAERSEFPPFLGTYPEVFQELFENLGPQGWIHVALFEDAEQPVAYQVGFCCGSRLWDYTKAYDRKYYRFAPGSSLLPALLNFGYRRGFTEYDFLRGEEPYKLVWSSGIRKRHRLLIWNHRMASRVRKFIYCDVKLSIRRHLLRSDV